MTLRTERLILREFTPRDWQAVHAYHGDPRYRAWHGGPPPTPEQTQAFIQQFLDWREERPRRKFQLAICLMADGRLIGGCGIRVIHVVAREATIDYELAPDHWGRGYATEAAAAILALGFGRLRVHRAWAEIRADNVASARVLEKLGLRREAILREAVQVEGAWLDQAVYGILDGEWRAARASAPPDA